MQLRARSGSLFHGVVSENLKCFARVWICRMRQFSEPSFQIEIAPSSIDLLGSGTILFSSISSSTPRPEQRGQAPYGELKEKSRGVSSPIEIPQSGQAYDCESSSSVPSREDGEGSPSRLRRGSFAPLRTWRSAYKILTRPFATRVAVSSESASRCSMPGLT